MVYVFAATHIYYITFCYKDFGLNKYPTEDKFISLVSGVASLFNGIGRLTAGFVIDKFGFYQSIMFA